MPRDTLTFALEGDVDLHSFAHAIQHLGILVEALSREIGKETAVSWSVDGLAASSAITTIRGESERPEIVERVVQAYAEVGKALVSKMPIPYPDNIDSAARAITEILNGRVKAIRFETPDEEFTISSAYGPFVVQRPTMQAYGAVEGRVETLARRKGLRFYLYDSLHDKAISCYVAEGQEEQMLGIWGRRVSVEGLITRDARTGQPTAIRQVTRIQAIPDDYGDYYKARVTVPVDKDSIAPEDVIRRLRDAE